MNTTTVSVPVGTVVHPSGNSNGNDRTPVVGIVAVPKRVVIPGWPITIAPLRTPKGTIAPKFAGGERKCVGLAAAVEQVAKDERCGFFDAAGVTQSSAIDGVHLDAEQHDVLGRALAAIVPAYL